ncbi:MAG: hypothetical protein M9936_17540 [Caldilinea sp.]|nr:hypothetical protein [Caldilinea sp.]MCO5211499.1 hypothetical protein [Caldilinea sp.]
MNRLFANLASTSIVVGLSVEDSSRSKSVTNSDDLSDCACSAPVPTLGGKMPEIFFANRISELDTLCNPGRGPLLLVEAPSGYGKTALLNRYREICISKGDLCAMIIVGNSGETLIRQRIAEQLSIPLSPTDDLALARLLRDLSSGIVMLFDNLDETEVTIKEWLVNELIPLCSQHCDLRVVLSLRNPDSDPQANPNSEADTPYLFLGYERIKLSPFNSGVIKQLIEETAKKSPPKGRQISRDETEGWAQLILRLSGGHPASIVNLVRELSEGWVLTKQHKQQIELFKRHVVPAIDHVTENIPKDLLDALEVLSVFRFFNLDTINYLSQERLLGEIDPLVFLQRLVRTGLVSKREMSPFYGDAIVRNLILTRMHLLDRERYQSVNRAAQAFYISQISQVGESGPKTGPYRPEELLKLYIRESLYHCFQQALTDGSTAQKTKLLLTCLSNHDQLYIEVLRFLGEDPLAPRSMYRIQSIVRSDADLLAQLKENDIELSLILELYPKHIPEDSRDSTSTPMDSVALKQDNLFRQALESAYTIDELNILTTTLGVRLEVIVPKDKTQPLTIMELVGYYRRLGRFPELVKAAYMGKPDNHMLKQFVEDYFNDFLTPDSGS